MGGCVTGCNVACWQQFIVRTLIIKKLGYLEADYEMLHTSTIRDCRGFESRQASCWEIYFCRREVVTSSKGGQIIHEMSFNVVHEQCVQYITRQKI